jgi:hypothetical protein
MPVFTVIDHTELGSATSSWSETSISSSYDHLLLKLSVRSSQSNVIDGMSMKFNSATTNYSETRITADTASPGSSRKHGESVLRAWGNAAGANTASDVFSVVTVWIPHYCTSNYKQFVSESSLPNTSTSDSEWHQMLGAGQWAASAAINRIDIGLVNGGNFVQYSTFTLYGVTN